MAYQASCAQCANDLSIGEKNGGITGMTSVIAQKGARAPTSDHKIQTTMT